MSLAAKALGAFEDRLPKVISPRTHGVIDYAHAAFFLTFALACRKKNPPAALAALGTGLLVLGESLLTDYPLGAKRVLPFEVHGQLDSGFAAFSFAIPKLFGFGGTKAAKVFQVNGLVEATVVGLTDFSNNRAHAERLTGGEDIVLDEDVSSPRPSREGLVELAQNRVQL